MAYNEVYKAHKTLCDFCADLPVEYHSKKPFFCADCWVKKLERIAYKTADNN